MNLLITRPALAASVALVIALTGCASNYQQFYKAMATPEVIAASRAEPFNGNPIVERRSPGDPKQILDAYSQRGYVQIGNSLFNSGRNESEENAIQQARAIGADLVLILNPNYTGSTTSSVPITTPDHDHVLLQRDSNRLWPLWTGYRVRIGNYDNLWHDHELCAYHRASA